MDQLYQESNVRELVTAALESFFSNKKPFLTTFKDNKKNINISKIIQADTTKELIQDNFREIIHFMSYAPKIESSKDLTKQLCKIIEPNSRSIVGRDLVNLFKMIDRYNITEDVQPLLINVAPNLMTIESQKLFNYRGTGLV